MATMINLHLETGSNHQGSVQLAACPVQEVSSSPTDRAGSPSTMGCWNLDKGELPKKKWPTGLLVARFWSTHNHGLPPNSSGQCWIRWESPTLTTNYGYILVELGRRNKRHATVSISRIPSLDQTTTILEHSKSHSWKSLFNVSSITSRPAAVNFINLGQDGEVVKSKSKEKTLWIWKTKHTPISKKNTNDHEDYDHQIITFSRSRIPTSSNRGTQQTLQPCPLRARADSFLCVVPAVNCQCHWYSPPPPGVAKIQSPKILEIHRYPSIPFPMVEHSMVAWKIAALHPNPWWILLPSSWTSPTLSGLLCVNNTTEQKLLLLLPSLKSVRAVRDQDVII